MVAQKQGPLAVGGNLRRLVENIDDGKPVFHVHGHKNARHHREVKRHVTFVAGAEIGDRLFRPLVGFGEKHAIAKFLVDMPAQLF